MKYLSIVILVAFLFSCQNGESDKSNNDQEETRTEQPKVQMIPTIEPDELKVVLPDSIPGYELAPFSQLSSKESDRVIQIAKYQFRNNKKADDRQTIIIDITDYGDIDAIPFSHIYDEPPKEINVVTDTLVTSEYKGYSIWSPVDFTGRSNVIVDDRFVIQVRSTANDTISKFLRSIVEMIDYDKLEELKNTNR
jgi:hypothetical protein